MSDKLFHPNQVFQAAEEDQKLWDRRDEESFRAFSAFVAYRDMGAIRKTIKESCMREFEKERPRAVVGLKSDSSFADVISRTCSEVVSFGTLLVVDVDDAKKAKNATDKFFLR